MSQPLILAVGDAMIDHFFFLHDAVVNTELRPDTSLLCVPFGDKIPVASYAATVAGNAANVAVGLRRLGCSTALATVIGRDVGGREILHKLKKERVTTRWITYSERAATNVSGVVSFRGERTILVHHTSRRYPRLPRGPFSWVYLTSLGPEEAEVLRVQREVLRIVTTTNARLAYNPGSHQLKLPRARLLETLPKTSVLFINKEEAQLIARLGHAPENHKDLLHALAKLGVDTIVMTDGMRGSYAYDHHKIFFCPPFPGRALERTGAGDSFGAGVTAALAHGKNLGEALRWGSANAANVVQKVGPQTGLLHRREMETLLKRYRRIQPKLL